MAGKLSIVATPIGNLEDITLRALRVLKEANVIFCEDTRVTRKLLDRYEIGTPLRRLDANTEIRGAEQIIACLLHGDIVAYVTDAGTPGISDPGYRLVAHVREWISARSDLPQGDTLTQDKALKESPLNQRSHLSEIVIEAIPGPSALTAALSIAGVPADNFIFLGFLPHKKGRQTALKNIAGANSTVVLYESSHRILKLLQELAAVVPNRQIVVVREITKKFEEVQVGTAGALFELFEQNSDHTKGEFVVIVEAQ